MKKATREEKMVRTSVTIPKSLKEKMDKVDINWSAALREAIRRRIDYEHQKNTVEAVLINEKLKRKAPEGWDSTKVIRLWRSKRQWPTPP
jgi:Arc/MetJ-type ribon-helix-helix transcriptional regulator